jgi:hypothetical protein
MGDARVVCGPTGFCFPFTLPKKVIVHHLDFTVDGSYFAITPDNIGATGYRFDIIAADHIKELYDLLQSDSGNAKFQIGETRLRIDPSDGSAPIFVDGNGIVMVGQRQYALGRTDFLRLDHLITDLSRQYWSGRKKPKLPQDPPIFDTVWANDYTKTKSFLDHGGNIEIHDRDDDSLLVTAVNAKSVPIVSLLLKRGASPNGRLVYDQPAIVCAVLDHQTTVLRLLLEHGANVDAETQEKRTALMEAIERSDDVATRLLLEKGANPNLVSDSGYTALMMAADHGRTDIAAMLLRHNADPHIAMKDGMTAVTWAEKQGNIPMIKLLQGWRKPN